ncbi:ABC transporter substrate-binding protein [Pectobacterium fontis]|uniref:ABC transporter substrate-binding protein n=1 Tax=Pectobacterium fontis TaxID=2558042 RepID=UPI00068F650B|nr:ABC transporter substrate-binding protein [Pectobacterium fontis]
MKINISPAYVIALFLGFLSAMAQAGTHVELRFADQNEETKNMVSASGEDKNLNYDITFANFIGGPAILEAFRSDALDIGIVGNTPPIQAQAANVPLLIVAARENQSPDYQYALRPGLSITSLADFKNKKIAYAEGTAREVFILQTLKEAGLTPSDVTLVRLRAGDFPTALQFGQVDIAPLTEQQFGRYIKQNNIPKTAFPDALYQTLPKKQVYLYASKKSLDNPDKKDAINDFITRWVNANKWTELHQSEWINAYYVKSQGLSSEDGKTVLQIRGQSTFPLLTSMISNQQKLIDILSASGSIPHSLSAEKEFDLRFNTVATQAAQSYNKVEAQ